MENGVEVDSNPPSPNNAEENPVKQADAVTMESDGKSPASDDVVSDNKSNQGSSEPAVDKPPIESAKTGSDNKSEGGIVEEELKDSGNTSDGADDEEMEEKAKENEDDKEDEKTKENGVCVVVDKVSTVKVETAPEEKRTLTPPPEKMEDASADDETTKDMSSMEETEEIDKKNSADNIEVEDQQSSTSSSPSALHIHLDDEDKDESLNGKDKEAVDPSLPLISNVVSLSSIASSSSSLTPPPPTRSEQSPSTQPPSPTPSAESGNSVRRTTLRFKRGIEISFDVDQNGQPVSVNNHDAAPMPTASSGEPRQKRRRLEDDDDEDANQPDLSELDAEGTNTVLSAVQKDIRTLRFMAKQKEKEWNYILKLMKVKEELQAKLMRRKEVLKITSSATSRTKSLPNTPQIHTVAQTQIQQQSGAANLQTLINHSLNAMMAKSTGSSKPGMSSSSVMNQQQQQQQFIQQQQQQLAQQLQQQAKLNRQRPILPKPSMQIHPEVQMWNQQQQQQHHHHHHHHHNNNSNNSNHHHHHAVVDSVVGACVDGQADARNRQGTISVQSLIADYRAKHPEEIPTRGRRIRQPSRICNDPNSSSSPPPQTGGQEGGGSMSFKDVLLQFAKMSSRQGHPNPVDMIQVGKESPGTSGNSAMGAGSSGSSSAAALQSLAAARNARSSPHATALSAGSILQSALSGSRSNPNFAPTLAQLLTNPANEQQQQQQQQQQQHPQQLVNQPTVSIPVAAAASSSVAAAAAAAVNAASSAEVLTLSNLLATARGHVTITSERTEHASDDVTVVGGSTSGRNASSSSNGNYLRTSGGSEVPKCQGCNERVAQFVCAGCSSQWYCSRECQVAAWEEHSEHCVG